MKTIRAWAPFGLYVIFALLLVALLVLRPRPSDVRFWLIVIPAGLAAAGYQIWMWRDDRREEKSATNWHRRVAALVDVQDFVDDGHLYEQFDPEERERLIGILERMPAGSRSLRQAIIAVDPEIVDEKA